jgi:hypothetical protein
VCVCARAHSKGEEHGAYAIVLSGGYKDDDDTGADLWYTGAGGQAAGSGAKKQVSARARGMWGAQLLRRCGARCWCAARRRGCVWARGMQPPAMPLTRARTHTRTRTQAHDQTFEHADNAALVRNWSSGTPVRVFRGRMGPGPDGKEERQYIYEGLYNVVDKRRVAGKDGPLVRASACAATATCVMCVCVCGWVGGGMGRVMCEEE